MMTRRSAACLMMAAAGCQRNTRKRIAVIPKATSHIFWLAVKAGAVAAGEKFGVEIEWNGPAAETDFARQIQIVDSAIARRFDGIVLAASDRKALVQVVDRAMSLNIPTTIFDSGLDSENYTSFVATGNVEAGRMAGRELGRLVGGKGKVAMIQHVPGSVSTQDRETGFEEVIAKDFPAIQVVQKLYGMSDRAKSMAAAENILTAHPDLDGIFASTEPSASGSILALNARGRGGKVKLVGFDVNETMVEAMQAATLDAMVLQDPFKIGFEAVKTVVDKINGQTPPKRMDLPAVVVTKANLDSPDMQRLVKPKLQQ
jgi:ribose transport system substrate-binding protein